MQTYLHLPAPLRLVRGFPALRLLQKLRPWCRPSPTIAVSPVPCQAGDPSSRVLISNLRVVRRRALPLAILETGHESRSHLGHDNRAQQQGWTYPATSDRFASNAITIEEALWINSEASVALFVTSS